MGVGSSSADSPAAGHGVAVHRRGAEAAESSSAVDDASNPVSERSDVEVDYETEMHSAQLEVGEQLTPMNGKQSVCRLHLDDELVFDEEIESQSLTYIGSFVVDGQPNLAPDLDPPEIQLPTKRSLIH